MNPAEIAAEEEQRKEGEAFDALREKALERLHENEVMYDLEGVDLWTIVLALLDAVHPSK